MSRRSRGTNRSPHWPMAYGLLLACAFSFPATGQTQHWITQLGSRNSDETLAAAPDGAGGVYLAGSTDGDLAGTNAEAGDQAVAACPTGSLLVKGSAFTVPLGERRFDRRPIGSEIEGSETRD